VHPRALLTFTLSAHAFEFDVETMAVYDSPKALRAYIACGHQVRGATHAAQAGVQCQVIGQGDVDDGEAAKYQLTSRTARLGDTDPLTEMPAGLKSRCGKFFSKASLASKNLFPQINVCRVKK
jgi:hypothetical protein